MIVFCRIPTFPTCTKVNTREMKNRQIVTQINISVRVSSFFGTFDPNARSPPFLNLDSPVSSKRIFKIFGTRVPGKAENLVFKKYRVCINSVHQHSSVRSAQSTSAFPAWKGEGHFCFMKSAGIIQIQTAVRSPPHDFGHEFICSRVLRYKTYSFSD